MSWLSHEVTSVSMFPHVSPKLRGWKCYIGIHSMRVRSYYPYTQILVGITECFGSWQGIFWFHEISCGAISNIDVELTIFPQADAVCEGGGHLGSPGK